MMGIVAEVGKVEPIEEQSLPSHPKFRHKQFFRSRTTSTPATLGFSLENTLESPLYLSLGRSDSESNNVTSSETSSSSNSSLSPTSSQEFSTRKRISISDEDGSRSSGSGEEKNGMAMLTDEDSPRKRRPYNPLPHAIKETTIYQDYRRRNADAVARCREKKKIEDQQRQQELDQLRRVNKDQGFEIEKLKLHNRALEHQITLYREQVALLSRHNPNTPKIMLPVAYSSAIKTEPTVNSPNKTQNREDIKPALPEEK